MKSTVQNKTSVSKQKDFSSRTCLGTAGKSDKGVPANVVEDKQRVHCVADLFGNAVKSVVADHFSEL